MVRRLVARRLLPATLAAAALLSLATCELFRMSAFPGFLSRVVVARDLGGQIDSLVDRYGDEWEGQVRVLRDAGGEDYVFVLVRVFGSTRLITLDSDLNVLGTFDDPSLGSRAMVDASNRFVIGKVVLNNPPSSRNALSAPGGSDDPGFASGGANFVLGVDGGVSPDELRYEEFDDAWTSLDPPESVPIDSVIRLDNWNLPLVFFDPVAAGKEVILVLNNWASGIFEIVFTPAAAYESGSLTGDVVAYPSFEISAWDIQDISYTRRGIVVSTWDRSLTVYDFLGVPRQGLQEEINTRNEIRQAYDMDGEYFYYFDKTERFLYKGLTGWPEL